MKRRQCKRAFVEINKFVAIYVCLIICRCSCCHCSVVRVCRAVVPNLFWFAAPLTKFCRYLAALLDGQRGIQIKELYKLVAPLAPLHGDSKCCGTPVGNHCCRGNIVVRCGACGTRKTQITRYINPCFPN